MRVLVVDDSTFMRNAISSMVSSDPSLTLVGSARNGQEGLDKIKELTPDVVTLDIEMPILDGLSALKRIFRECTDPPAVLVCSSLTTKGSHEALKALRLGAADVMAKEASGSHSDLVGLKAELLAKIKVIGQARAENKVLRKGIGRPIRPGVSFPTSPAALPPGVTIETTPPDFRTRHFDMLVIGSSTGGPPVLETIFGAFPKKLPMPIVVAQHMPLLFTKSMSERLREMCKLDVVHGENGMALENGKIYILPGGLHGRIKQAGVLPRLDISPEPTTAPFRPSVNELFGSAGKIYGKRCLGVMLTGMGDDGCKGAKILKDAGGLIIAQSPETCAVYGMPRAVTVSGIAAYSLSPDEIAKTLSSLAAPGVKEAA